MKGRTIELQGDQAARVRSVLEQKDSKWGEFANRILNLKVAAPSPFISEFRILNSFCLHFRQLFRSLTSCRKEARPVER